MTTTVNLADLTLGQLLSVYNQLSEKPLKKFGQHSIAEARVAPLLAAGKLAITTQPPLKGEFTLVEGGLYLCDMTKAKPAAKVEPKHPLVQQFAKAMKAATPAKPATPKKPAAKKPTKAKAAPQTAATRYADDMVIMVLAEANPKKAGSMAAGRFALYTSGMTVAEYRDAVVKHDEALGLSRKQGMLDSRNDLAFDSERAYIAVATKGK